MSTKAQLDLIHRNLHSPYYYRMLTMYHTLTTTVPTNTYPHKHTKTCPFEVSQVDVLFVTYHILTLELTMQYIWASHEYNIWWFLFLSPESKNISHYCWLILEFVSLQPPVVYDTCCCQKPTWWSWSSGVWLQIVHEIYRLSFLKIITLVLCRFVFIL